MGLLRALPSLQAAGLVKEPRLHTSELASMLRDCPGLAWLRTDWEPREDSEEDQALVAAQRLRLQHGAANPMYLPARQHELMCAALRAAGALHGSG